VGKTLLALAVVDRLAAQFHDGVAVVDLVAIQDPSQFAAALGRALRLSLSESRPLETIGDFLHDRHLLPLLDQFEHVLDAAPAGAQLLRNARDVKIVPTSREPLRLRDERLYVVCPLDVPPGWSSRDHARTALEIGSFSAVRLFEERARAVRPDFELTDG